MGFADDVIRDVQVATKDLTDPKAKSARLAAFARAEIAKVDAENRASAGREVPHTVAVDGRQGAPLSSVRPDGVIVAEWSLHIDVLAWIGDALLKASPRLTGRYEASHILFIDGVQHEPGDPIKDFEEAIFINGTAYARKIEKGESAQAPDGVYQAVAAVARQRFNNIAKVRFSYRSLQGGGTHLEAWAAGTNLMKNVKHKMKAGEREDWLRRQPAIVVVPN